MMKNRVQQIWIHDNIPWIAPFVAEPSEHQRGAYIFNIVDAEVSSAKSTFLMRDTLTKGALKTARHVLRVKQTSKFTRIIRSISETDFNSSQSQRRNNLCLVE